MSSSGAIPPRCRAARRGAPPPPLYSLRLVLFSIQTPREEKFLWHLLLFYYPALPPAKGREGAAAKQLAAGGAYEAGNAAST